MILIQYMNARDEFRYHFPHPQVMRYLGYRIGGKKGTRGGKMTTLVAYRNGDLVDMCNLGTVRYRFVVRFITHITYPLNPHSNMQPVFCHFSPLAPFSPPILYPKYRTT